MKLTFVPAQHDFEVRFGEETLGILPGRHFEAARAKAIEVNRRVSVAACRDPGAILYAQLARTAMQPYLLPN